MLPSATASFSQTADTNRIYTILYVLFILFIFYIMADFFSQRADAIFLYFIIIIYLFYYHLYFTLCFINLNKKCI